MAIFNESDSENEVLNIPNIVLPYKYEPLQNQLDVDELANSSDAVKIKRLQLA